MLSFALNFAFVAFGFTLLLALSRLLKGPRLADRLLALDTMYINAMGLVLLLGIKGLMVDSGVRSFYFELALLIAVLGFVSTVAGARFLARGDAIE